MSFDGASHMVPLDLIGGFQADNVMLAAGLVIACGAEPLKVFDALPKLQTVRGRMELVAIRSNGAMVFIDLHTRRMLWKQHCKRCARM